MKNGYTPKLRPSEHQISDKFGIDNGGAIPPNIINDPLCESEIGSPVGLVVDVNPDDMETVNLLAASNTASNDIYQRRCRAENIQPHPARFPAALPEFVIGLCTQPGDLVLDPFAGSNTTGFVAEKMGRRWIGLEMLEEYLKGSKFRFEEQSGSKTMGSLYRALRTVSFSSKFDYISANTVRQRAEG